MESNQVITSPLWDNSLLTGLSSAALTLKWRQCLFEVVEIDTLTKSEDSRVFA